MISLDLLFSASWGVYKNKIGTIFHSYFEDKETFGRICFFILIG